MRQLVRLAVLWAVLVGEAAAAPEPLVKGLDNPTSVVTGTDGRVFIAIAGVLGKDGDGAVLVLQGGKTVPFASGLNDPQGLATFQQWLFAADKDRVWRIDPKGKAQVLAGPKAFPVPPQFLQDVAADEYGTLYVSDPGQGKGRTGAIYRIDQRGKVSLVANAERTPGLEAPAGLLADGTSHLFVLNSGRAGLLHLAVADGKAEKLAEDVGSGGGGLAWDWHGRLYLTRDAEGDVLVIPRPGEKPVLLAEGFQMAVDLCADTPRRRMLVVDRQEGTLTALPANVPGAEVDETPLPIETAVAFPGLKWTGWKEETDSGRPNPLRPIVLTHPGDGSDRVFVATQHGVIHAFPNDPKADKTKVFLDISAKVRYTDAENEEGFLGLTFHPQYRKNGEFFVFYTDKKARLENVVCRFRVSKDDPDRADPASEEELLRVKRPFWNHDGGTICFGPDGYLYVALGDGGAANDPFDNAQNLKNLLGKVLRIDVDRKADGKPYAIPKDNPFVGRPGARGEIWAYGLRNVWRMAFDRKTGELWAGDVGQNLWEEIVILTAGGNYGWNRRESLHAFGAKGTGPRKDLIEPVWEYHHDVGKSITGGLVYRGKRLKELDGAYVYGDYVSTKIWALRHDPKKGRVVANRPIRDRGLPILSFGEDEQGEIYLLTPSSAGQGVYQLVPSRPGKSGG